MRWEWRPYVPVARRRANAARQAAKLQKKGDKVQPIQIEGRAIARTFWGKAWCDNLEGYSDFENRLPRGRTYVRNGSVIDLKIHKGRVQALVSGAQIYQVNVSINPVAAANWKQIIRSCAGSIDSLMDLLQGRFADGVMKKLTSQTSGLFPTPGEIQFGCSCPDWASMCKHIAAVLYGIGARLDAEPELLFVLRDADHLELVAEATATGALDSTLRESTGRALESDDLESVFGIDLEGEASSAGAGATKKSTSPRGRKPRKVSAPTRKKASSKEKQPPDRAKAKPRAAKKKAKSAATATVAAGKSTSSNKGGKPTKKSAKKPTSRAAR